LRFLIAGLQEIMLNKEFEMATETMNSREIKRLGMAFAKSMVQDLPVKERLEGVSLEERLRDFTDDEISRLLEARKKGLLSH